jgi:Lrp/AsnC family transcriptional regulator, leucine-responsive regulatory protein
MLDLIDWRMLQALAKNARISLKDLANQASLSSPSAAERLRRLEERGVIRSYTVELDPHTLGYPLQAMVRVRPLPGKVHIVQELLDGIAEVGECDKVTGEDCFIVRIFARSIEQLDEIIDRIADKAETNTSIVKSTPIARRLPPLSSQEELRRSGVTRASRSSQPMRSPSGRRRSRGASRSGV